MHGRRRAEYKARMSDPKVVAGLQHKAKQWFKLNDELIHRDGGSLELISNLLTVNPDPLYLWNRRRALLGDTLDDLEAELKLTQTCLERNPKAYGTWFHRKWCILKAGREESILQRELALCAQFLNLDERNFHCWNYRRFVVGCLCGSTNGETVFQGEVVFGSQVGGESDSRGSVFEDKKTHDLLEAEVKFTTEKIQQNFSNGSAFHYRCKLLTYLPDVFSLEDELELIHNAIFTEPDDQTAWWYLQFLLEKYHADFDLETEKSMLEELLEAEGGESKWVLLGLYHVLQYMEGMEEEQEQILSTLIRIDPDRKVRYENMVKTT
mmetsp:Transcript_1752/g.2411  ORF Transcript_1752/g.2411 Transcript_1752/m.2411 type:complete len:323 (+) Transcript_1752:77-1045(+)